MARFGKILVIITLMVVSGLVGYFWHGGFSEKPAGLEIDFKTPERMAAGTPFTVEVGIFNKTESVLDEAELTLNLPPGVVFVGKSPEKNFEIRDLGSLGLGGLYHQSFDILALENSGQKTIEATVRYSLPNINSRFEESQKLEISFGEGGVGLEVSGPKEVISGEEFTLDIHYKNDSAADLENLKLTLSPPPEFSLKKNNKTQWELGRVRAGDEEEFSVKGSLIGEEGRGHQFRLVLEGEWQGEVYVLGEKLLTVDIGQSPIILRVAANGGISAVRPGEELYYTIQYENTDKSATEIEIQTQLIGEMFDLSTVAAEGGQYSPGTGTILWQEIAPDGGTISLRVKVKPDFTVRRVGDKNYTLKINLKARSGEATGVARLETKVAGLVKVKTMGFFRDAPAGILNNGPLPPRVGEPTQFTVHWQVVNATTDVKNVEVKAILPPNVRFTNITKVELGSNLLFNENVREIIWKLERLSSTRGSIDRPPEAVFQIELTPTEADKGQFVPLLGQTQIVAEDEFTGLLLSNYAPPLTSVLPDDPTVGQAGMVIQ